MNRCVPNWNLDENCNRDASILDHEVTELTWENGQLTMHGLGPRRPADPKKPHSTASTLTKCTWDKPRAAETLEAIVNQATLLPHGKTHPDDVQVPWLNHHKLAPIASGIDALVPGTSEPPGQGLQSGATRVGSCSGDPSVFENRRPARGGAAAAAAAHEWSSGRDQSVSGSGNFGMESSRQLTSTESPENTSSGKQSPDEHDSVCHSRHQEASEKEEMKKGKGKGKGKGKSSSLTKRSRIAAVHNQSERKRRDKINQRMKTLQKLVPNASKTDKASMLDEVIEYLKHLQAQVHMMSRMNMSPMMMPLAMQQQQLQMSMMMGMGMGMGMGGMDMNNVGRSNIPAAGFHPSAFMHMPSWDGHGGDHHRSANPTDPMSAFLACQSQSQQSMTMEAYSRMAALFQQMQNQSCGSLPKN